MGRDFLSDNSSGIHPEVLAAIGAVNDGHQPAYGEDAVTARVSRLFGRHFGPDSETFLVLNGTGANVVALRALTRAWGAVICADSAHLNTSEGGAPEKVGGLKLLAVAAPSGKLTPDYLPALVASAGDQQAAQVEVVSLSQSTELGTVYSLDELRDLCQAAHTLGLRVHMDGARVCNAAAALNVPLRALTADVGVDVLSCGGTKNGLMLGEAVVVLRPGLADGMKYLRKLNMQLCSKMRFIAAQFEALLGTDLWRRNALHANAMARLLESGLREIADVEVTQPVQANAVFVAMPEAVASRVRQDFAFHVWDRAAGVYRLMTSFDTEEADVHAFVKTLTTALTAARKRGT